MKTWMFALGLAAVLSACSSTKLDTPPVEDKKGTSVEQTTGNKPGDATVTTVVTDKPGSGDAAGPKGERIVYFDFDSYVVKPESQPVVESQARYLKAHRGSRVQLDGHTDEQGGREYNLALGQRRAEAVRKQLVLLGVADSQLEAVSFGKEKPAVQGQGDAAYAKNRRVEFSYR